MGDCTFIIFGVTGDLACRKLLPALYRLVAHKKINNFVIVGVAIDQETSVSILSRAKQFITEIDEVVWQNIVARFHYQVMDFTNQAAYGALRQFVDAHEQRYALNGNRLFYLATAAHYFCPITRNVGSSGLAVRAGTAAEPWQRFVYEKPFGHDLQSAHEINECIASLFDERQIYRIDHYLTKELVGNIALVRFTNAVFEPLWNNQYISQVQIVLSESNGIENRGPYYDSYGALRDVVQNHMLELLALIAMEAPKKLTGDFIRAERAKVLEKVKVIDAVRGQYDGYKKEKI